MLKLNEKETETLLAELQDKIAQRWKEKVDATRFMDELNEGTLKMDSIKLFYQNWGAFVPVINSIYAAAFYKHLWFFVKNVDLMEPYTEKILDEFGHPAPPGHIRILISTGAALGLSREETLLSPMLPEARGLADFQRTLLVDGPIHEYWFSVLWEFAFGMTCTYWSKALTSHYGLAPADVSYFTKHYEADTMDHLDRKAHSEITKIFLLRLLKDGIIERYGYPVEYCALTPVDLYAAMLNGVYNATQ